jgi:putative OPT family oligopeptide transporter
MLHPRDLLVTTAARPTELTIRGIVLGILITFVFTAANVYIGLKVAFTFATSIPAAVISMAVLSAFKNASILENNIVQTVASAAGTLSAIIFVLPGLVIVGWWSGFPFWTTFLICASGGVLGVLFTIPLRRAMVTNSELPYPEGVAAAEVLEVGHMLGTEATTETRTGLTAVIFGALASSLMALLEATRLMATELRAVFRMGPSATSFNMSFSLALLGAGYLVGLSVGLAMLLGLAIAWLGAVPVLSTLIPQNGAPLGDFVHSIWYRNVRFIGAGAMGVAALWTLTKLVAPVVRGVIATMAAAAKPATDLRDVDLSPTWIALLSALCLAVVAYLLKAFLGDTPFAAEAWRLIMLAVPFVVIGGFAVSAVTGYMAGLIGASNSPISGVGILAILVCATLLLAFMHPAEGASRALVAFALFTTTIVFAMATISNNNLQDLKTGQLVGATPRAQQIALIIGVVAGALVIPPVLNVLNQANGFAGGPRLATAIAAPLSAPQANLISTLAQGVIEQRLDWHMIGIGAVIGLLVVLLDGFLGARKWLRLPPLAVGMGIYLPMAVTMPVVIGAVLGHVFDRWSAKPRRSNRGRTPEQTKRLAVLVASGMIVGESLFGVLNAGLIVAFGKEAPLGIVSSTFAPAPAIGWMVFALMILELSGWLVRRART